METVSFACLLCRELPGICGIGLFFRHNYFFCLDSIHYWRGETLICASFGLTLRCT